MILGNTPDKSGIGPLLQCYIILKFAGAGRAALPDGEAQMGRFRPRSRLGSYLALFALAFQLAVSFGHVHLDHLAPTLTGATALTGAPPSGDEGSTSSNPTGHENRADDLCPICTLIHLAGTLVPAGVPPLPLPRILGGLRLEAAVAFDLAASQSALFQARAPPLA